MKAIISAFAILSLLLLQLVSANDLADIEADNFMNKRNLDAMGMPTKFPTKFPTKKVTASPSVSPTNKPTPAPTTPYKSTKIAAFNYVTGFTFLPNGVLVVAERTSGKISTYNIATNQTTLIAEITGIDPTPAVRDGLVGVAVNPNFAKNPFIFVYVTRHVDGKACNQIVKLKWNAKMTGMTTTQTVIWSMDRVMGATNDGGRIAFGPDGLLYASVGDQNKAALAQNMTVDAGKILRMTTSGGVPKSNPFKGSHIYAYGYRNTIGFTFDKKTKSLWGPDNGPTCNDELNLITKGGNYGWGPKAVCPDTNQDGENIQLPKLVWNGRPVAPTGAAFAMASNDLFIGHYIPSSIRLVMLDATRTNVAMDHGVVYYLPTSEGFILALEADAKGNLFYGTTTGIYKLELK